MAIQRTKQAAATAFSRIVALCVLSLFFVSCVTDKATTQGGSAEKPVAPPAAKSTPAADETTDEELDSQPAKAEGRRSVVGRIVDTVTFRKDRPEATKPVEAPAPEPAAVAPTSDAAQAPSPAPAPPELTAPATPGADTAEIEVVSDAITDVSQASQPAPRTCPYSGKTRMWVIAAIAAIALPWIYRIFSKAPAGKGALSRRCHENIEALAELFHDYRREHGGFPATLQELVPMGLDRLEAFTCEAVGAEGTEMLVSSLAPESMYDVTPPRAITYLYFPAGFKGMRVVCPAWHRDSVGIDLLGNVVGISRERWEELSEALASGARE